MNNKSRLINILLSFIIIFTMMFILGQKSYAASYDYTLTQVPIPSSDHTHSGGLLLKHAPTTFLGKIFTWGSGGDINAKDLRSCAACIQEYNNNLAKKDQYWKVLRVMDFNLDSNSKITNKPLYGKGYASGKTDSGSYKLYAKFAAYAYWQNNYEIDAYLTLGSRQTWRTTLKNLMYELKGGEWGEKILVDYQMKYLDLPAAENKTPVNSQYSQALKNYCEFADTFNGGNSKLFAPKTTTIKYDGTYLGPYNVMLASTAKQKSVDVPYTYNKQVYGSTKPTSKVKLNTGLKITGVRVTLKNGTSFTTNIKRKSGSSYVNVDLNTFDWRSDFYLEKTNLNPADIKSINLEYSATIYGARYILLDGKYGTNKYSTQGYMAYQGTATTVKGTLGLAIPSNGALTITKVDKNNSNKKLSGVTFEVLRDNGGGKATVVSTITTNANGQASCVLPMGYTYYLRETKATDSNYDYKQIGVKSSTIKGAAVFSTVKLNGNSYQAVKITAFTKKSSSAVSLGVVLTNPQKNNDTGVAVHIDKRCSETGRTVNGVTFDLYRTQSHDGRVDRIATRTTDQNGNINFGSLAKTYTWYTYETRSSTWTDKDGNSHTSYYTVSIPHTGYYSYNAVEVSTNERYIYQRISSSISDSSTARLYNNPKRQTIRGKVFEDVKGGKESEYDGIYSGSDKTLSGILVTLKDKNNESFSRTTRTNSAGEYEFSNLSQFGSYYVQFSYNGQEYMATEYKVGGSSYYGRNSLAMEDENERNEYNQKFEVITPTTAANNDTTMKAYTSVFDDMYLQYENKSELGSLMSITDREIIISNVNLGLVKRQKADLAIEKDVYSATVKIKDYEQTYMYNSRRLDSDFSTWDIKDRLSVEGYYSKVYNRAIYASDYEYKCELYNNTGVSVSSDTELKVYITYILKVKNCSQSIVGRINELVDYYDSDYTYVPEMSYVNVNNSNETLEVAETSNYGTQRLDGFKNLYIRGLDSYDLISGDYLNLYLTFEVNKDQNKNLLIDQDLHTMTIKTGKENLAEINAFSTYYGENTILPNRDGDQAGEIAGLFDMDSTPGNLNNSNKYNKNAYEDDTAVAPNITVTISTEVREISGYVWEDKRNQYSSANGTNIGNGVRENDETLINGVTVDLVEKIDDHEIVWKTFKTGSIADLNPIFRLNIDGKDLVTINKNEISTGKYIFKSFMPGNYYLRFHYGDSYDTALTKNTNWCGAGNVGANENSYNGIDYKSTIYKVGNEDRNSDAKDIWAVRQDVDKYSTIMSNKNASVLAVAKQKIYQDDNKNLDLAKELVSKTAMTAITEDYDLEVEYKDKYKIENVDFGITERPKAQLVLNKTVENVKVILSDGTILYHANDKMAHVLWNSAVEGHKVSNNKGLINGLSLRNKKGLIQLTVDEEYMTGATVIITYKLTVTNQGEVDYNEESFYNTGNVVNASTKVKAKATKVIDYVDNNLGFDASQNEGWQVIEKDKLTNGMVSENIKDNVNSYNTIIVTEDLAKDLAPGESVSKQLVLTKTLSSNEDETSFTNNAEIVEFSTPTGANSKASIPGNQNPNEAPAEVDAEDAETVTLLTPFGAAKIAFIKAGIVVAALAIIATGIVIIKKRIIKTK